MMRAVARVVITRPLPGAPEELLRAAGHRATARDGTMPPSPEELRTLAADAEGLLCLLTERVDAELLDACPSIRAISNMAVGTDNIDLEECRRRGIDPVRQQAEQALGVARAAEELLG